MLNVDERLKELYRADSTDKQLILDFYHKGEDEPYTYIYCSRWISKNSYYGLCCEHWMDRRDLPGHIRQYINWGYYIYFFQLFG